MHTQTQAHTHKIRLAYLENGMWLAVCVRRTSFILMMYTDIHSVLFQFAFNQWRFMVIHGLWRWSQSNPGSGPGRFMADRAVNFLLRWRGEIAQRAHKFSAQQFKGQPPANYSSGPPTSNPPLCALMGVIYPLTPHYCFVKHVVMLIS